MTVKQLRELLARLPDESVWDAYEGEDSGIVIQDSSGEWPWFISCTGRGYKLPDVPSV